MSDPNVRDDDELTAYRLASLAKTADPDSVDSEGAAFLCAVAQAHADACDELSDDDSADPDRTLREHLEAVVPVGTWELWRVFVDLGAWEEDIRDAGGQPVADELTDSVARPALMLIAERLSAALAQRERDAWARHAAFLGDDAGAAMGALAILSDDEARAIADADGTAEVWRALGDEAGPNLSGQFADDPTPDSLADELGVPHAVRVDGWTLSELCDAWDDAAGPAFLARVRGVALRQVGRVSEALTVERDAEATSERLLKDHEGTDSERAARELSDALDAARDSAERERNGQRA